MLRYYPTLDQSHGSIEKSQKLTHVESIIQDQVAETITLVWSPEDADVILVGWGDGYMLQMMRQYKDYDAVFFGINAGTLWFLTNHMDTWDQLPQSLSEMEIVSCPIIPVDITYRDGSTKQSFFLNDVAIGDDIMNYYNFSLENTHGQMSVFSSGLVINTPQWSTWYAANLKQPILDLHSKMMGIAAIGGKGFDYTYMKPQTLTISDLHQRDTLNVWVDGKAGERHHDIQSITIYPSEKSVRLGFLPDQNYHDRRVLLAEQSHGNTIDTSFLSH